MEDFEQKIDAINAVIYASKGFKKIGNRWFRPVYYWEAWDRGDFVTAGCIAAQRERTGIHAWASLDGEKAIVEKSDAVILETSLGNLYPGID